jgi:hypothetical protein
MISGFLGIPLVMVAPTPTQTFSPILTLPAIATRGASVEFAPTFTSCESAQLKLTITFSASSQVSDMMVPANI